MGAGLAKQDKNVVILGSSHAAVEIANKLINSFNITIISPTNSLIHKVAQIRSVTVDDWEKQCDIPLTNLTKQGATLIADKAVSIEGKKVLLESGKVIDFDYCVIAIGSTNSFADFCNHDPSQENRLKKWSHFRESVKDANNIVIAGGGVVGIEVAGEIKSKFPDKKITIVHNHSTLINNKNMKNGDVFPARFTTSLLNDLTRIGISIDLNHRAEVNFEGKTYLTDVRSVKLSGGSEKNINADLVINCAGNRLNTIKGIPEEDKNGIMVDGYFRVKGLTDVFAIGDCASCGEDNKLMYSIKKHASLAANVIIATEKAYMTGKGGSPKLPKVHKPMTDVVSFVPIGPRDGTGVMGNTILFRSLVTSAKSNDLFLSSPWALAGGVRPPKPLQ